MASRGPLREARERLVEREAIRILEHPREVLWIQYSATCHADCRASSGAIHDAVLRIEHVAHQQRASAVRAVHARTRVRIAEIEPAVYPLAGIVGVGVYLLRAADELAEVAPELDVVVDPRTAPDLSRVPHVRITVGDELLGVVPLHAAARRRAVAVFDAQVGESAFAERQADIARNREALAVASSVPARAELQAAARVGVFQDEVHHASDGIRTVLRGRAVVQHFGMPQRDRGNHRQVGALRAVEHGVREPVDDRGAVPPLAVDEHERVIGSEIPQACGPNNRPPVADRLRVHVERRDGITQLIG